MKNDSVRTNYRHHPLPIFVDESAEAVRSAIDAVAEIEAFVGHAPKTRGHCFKRLLEAAERVVNSTEDPADADADEAHYLCRLALAFRTLPRDAFKSLFRTLVKHDRSATKPDSESDNDFRHDELALFIALLLFSMGYRDVHPITTKGRVDLDAGAGNFVVEVMRLTRKLEGELPQSGWFKDKIDKALRQWRADPVLKPLLVVLGVDGLSSVDQAEMQTQEHLLDGAIRDPAGPSGVIIIGTRPSVALRSGLLIPGSAVAKHASIARAAGRRLRDSFAYQRVINADGAFFVGFGA